MKFALAALGLSATKAYTCSWIVDSWLGETGAGKIADACVVPASGKTAGTRVTYDNVAIGSCSGDYKAKVQEGGTIAAPAATLSVITAKAKTDATAIHLMVHWCKPAPATALAKTVAAERDAKQGLLFYSTYTANTCATLAANAAVDLDTKGIKVNSAAGNVVMTTGCIPLSAKFGSV